MAEPCRSSHGELRIRPSRRSALRAAHECGDQATRGVAHQQQPIMVGRDQVGRRVKLK